MAGKCLWKLCVILGIILHAQFSFAQDTIRVILPLGSHMEDWLIHKNIIGFAVKPGMQPFEPAAVVGNITFANNSKNFMAVHFKSGASEERKTAYLDKLKQQGEHQPLIAMSKPAEAGSPFHNKMMFIDDKIIIAFKESPTRAYLNALMEKYDLQFFGSGEESLIEKTVYTFRYTRFTESDNSATVSFKIFQAEKPKVLSVHPNRVNLFEPQSTGDDMIDLTRQTENNPQQVTCSSLQGQHLEDARVTGAWNAGFTGQDVKVGVIDFFGFDYNHPDMQGQMLAGWDCINNTDYNASNFYFTDPTQSHGMAVSGVVAAKGLHVIGSPGVAKGAKVVPFLIDGSEVSVVIAMQKARSSEFDVDIVNCSFGSYFPSPAIQNEIKNLSNHGRNRNGNALGIIVVSSHGNDNYRDIEYPQYPAAYDEVISVGSATPDDRKKIPTDSWNTAGAWGSNYGALLNLGAPGVCIYTTDISGPNGYSSGDYVAFQKTSASAPIVSGVAAIVLSKYPELTWQELRTKLHDTADKTNNAVEGGGYNYNYDATKPGKSMEMGYGRVNAEKAVSEGPVGMDESLTGEKNRIKINSLANSSLDIRYSLGETINSAQMAVLDMSGRVLMSLNMTGSEGAMQVDVNGLNPGMYIVRCVSGYEVIANEKFVKTR